MGIFLSPAGAQTSVLSFQFVSNSTGNYRQGPGGVLFEGGSFGINVQDGNAIFDGCAAPFYFGRSRLCPLGATGFVTAGDVDGDGSEDAGFYYSITQVSAAKLIRPFAGSASRLVAAPPSRLPRPLGGFTDDSRSLFFNLMTPFIQQFALAEYDFVRNYAANQRSAFDEEVVPGTYRYNLPSQDPLGRPAVIEINQFPTLEGFTKKNNIPVGFKFTNLTFEDGFALIDPFIINEITWTGNTVNLIAPGSDRLYLSIKPLSVPSDPLSDPVQFRFGEVVLDNLGFPLVDEFFNELNPTLPIFPNFLGPNVTRVLLPNPLIQRYTLAPNFLSNVPIGDFRRDVGLLELEFEIFRPTTGVIFDQSVRRFRLPIKLQSRFDSVVNFFLPPTATAAQKSKTADFDGDGVSNFAEWAFGSDPGDAKSSPSVNAVEDVSVLSSIKSGGTAATALGAVSTTAPRMIQAKQYSVFKTPNAIPALEYSIQFSRDMKTWSTISKFDPRWKVLDTSIKKTVISLDPDISKGGGFFRASVVEAKLP